MSENTHDNSKSNGNFSGSNSHDEEHENLPRSIPQFSTDCDESEICRVEHQFDTHKDNDCVSPDEHADYPDSKEQRA